MDLTWLVANYRVDIREDFYMELCLNVDRKKILERAPFEKEGFGRDFLLARYRLVSEDEDMGCMEWEVYFDLHAGDETLTGLFDANLLSCIKKKRRILEEVLQEYPPNNWDVPRVREMPEYRWLFEKRAFDAVIPILRKWDHAILYVEMESLTCKDREGKPKKYVYHTRAHEGERFYGGENIMLSLRKQD